MTEIKKHIKYEGISLKRNIIPGLNYTWIGTDEAIIQGEDTIYNTIKNIDGITVTELADVPIVPEISEPPPTQDDIDEKERKDKSKKTAFDAEIARINTELGKEYVKEGGTGTPPKIKSLSEVKSDS